MLQILPSRIIDFRDLNNYTRQQPRHNQLLYTSRIGLEVKPNIPIFLSLLQLYYYWY